MYFAIQRGFVWLVCVATFASRSFGANGVTTVVANDSQITLTVQGDQPPVTIVELQPFQSATDATNVPGIATITKKRKTKISIPRFDGARDRLYSGFLALASNSPSGQIHFVEEFKNISKHRDTYPRTKSKKGLQVQMVDDAIALGVKHAALNFNFGAMVNLNSAPDDFEWPMDGRTFHFRRSYIEATDERVKTLTTAGANVTLILLNYEGSNEALNKVLLHPSYDKTCPEHLSAFNTATPEGLAWFKACVEFLANRYSEKNFPHGRVVNYIVGNEVNTHWMWANMGHVSMEEFARDYSRTVRVCATAVRKFSSSARVFISLEHHWNIHFAGGDTTQSFAGRPFVDYFNQLAKESGDFEWNIAFHPYPEDLFNCKTWNDKSATFSTNTPRITFKNIEMLPRYLKRPEMLCHGELRRIILSEQGFHSPPTPEGERTQAAAYCYAYRKVAELDGIDAFILHRHVDHGGEYGLNLGLWRRNPSSGPCEPLSKKPIYEVFAAADTSHWKKDFEFALPIIGIKSWKDIEHAPIKK